MTLEQIQEKARKYATEALVNKEDYHSLYNGYIAGYGDCEAQLKEKSDKWDEYQEKVKKDKEFQEWRNNNNVGYF